MTSIEIDSIKHFLSYTRKWVFLIYIPSSVTTEITRINTLDPHCSKACNQNANDEVITTIVDGTMELIIKYV